MSSSGLTRGSLYEILEFLRNSNSRCPLGFALAAVKTRLQGREVIFWNFGVGLAVGHRSGSVQASFALIFQASRERVKIKAACAGKRCKSSLVRCWAA